MKKPSFQVRYTDKVIKTCEKHGIDFDKIMKLNRSWGGPRPRFLVGEWGEPSNGEGLRKDIPPKALYIFELIDDEMILIYRDDGVEFFDYIDKYDNSLDWYTKKKKKKK